MNPIYNEYIKFLDDNKVDVNDLKLQEGYYWLDKQIIKCFDKNGNIHKVARIYINDDLNITYKKYEDKKLNSEDIISWQQLMNINRDRLNKIEADSLELIKNSMSKYSNSQPIVLSSTGKDSMVVLHLVRKINRQSMCIFNNTSLDCADTYKMAKSIDNCICMSPKEGFYQWRERLNFIPTRFSRACCSIFKEGEFARQWNKDKETLIFLGMRNEESNTRSEYGDNWHNDNTWPNMWYGVLPIRKWTELDVWLYILKENIPINDKYKKGYSRVGCAIACPYYTKSTWILDKYWYPISYQRWHQILDNDFINNNKDLIMNCTQNEYHTKWNGGIVRDVPTREVIDEFATRNSLDKKVAENYFNHKCDRCNKKIKHKDVLGMNMKFYGRNINKFKCKKCLMEDLGIDKQQWQKYVDDFKAQGCKLF